MGKSLSVDFLMVVEKNLLGWGFVWENR